MAAVRLTRRQEPRAWRGCTRPLPDSNELQRRNSEPVVVVLIPCSLEQESVAAFQALTRIMELARVSTEETVVIPQIMVALSVVHRPTIVGRASDSHSDVPLHSVIEARGYPVIVRRDHPVRLLQALREEVPNLPIVDVLIGRAGLHHQRCSQGALIYTSIRAFPPTSAIARHLVRFHVEGHTLDANEMSTCMVDARSVRAG
mmetsp:Transcript_65611/g.173755  ORF Transcript_65611/g.173755 Transcript_65611/m.173755 type:complete len:202 (-) Transcript_65611:176-781(-)